MPKRPLSLTLVCWLFIVVGVGGIVHGVRPLLRADLSTTQPTAALTAHDYIDAAWATGSGVVAILGGALMLCGRMTGVVLAVAWMLLHIWISYLHSWEMVVTHAVIFALVGVCMFRPAALAYFRAARSGRGRAPEEHA